MRSPELRKLAASLGAHVAKHNWQVLGFTVLTLLAAATSWGGLYFGVYWIVLVLATAADADVPKAYPVVFGAVSIGLLLAAWFDRLVASSDRPSDRRPFAELFLDVVLLIPRITLAIWGNLSAWQWLSHSELQCAAALVERVARERQVSVLGTPLDIPDDRIREKVVFALLLLRVIEIVRREDEEPRLRISPFRPSTLRIPGPRISTD